MLKDLGNQIYVLLFVTISEDHNEENQGEFSLRLVQHAQTFYVILGPVYDKQRKLSYLFL